MEADVRLGSERRLRTKPRGICPESLRRKKVSPKTTEEHVAFESEKNNHNTGLFFCVKLLLKYLTEDKEQ